MVEKTGITNEEEIFKKLKKEGYVNLFVWSDPPNAFYDWHVHPFNEVRWVVEGEITIETEERVYRLKPGDKLKVPAGTRHKALVGSSGVTYVCGSKLKE